MLPLCVVFFYKCKNLNNVDLNKFNLYKNININGIFYKCNHFFTT